METSGDIDLTWNAVAGAQAYVIHYGDANTTDPTDATYMGYSETTDWTLPIDELPVGTKVGDKIPFYIQAFDVVGVGANDVDKAEYLNASPHITGSAWSSKVEATVTKVKSTTP